MPDIFVDYVSFIEHYVLPAHLSNPDWIRLDGRKAGDPTPTTYPKVCAHIIENRKIFGVHNDVLIENLLSPYRAWKAGDTIYPVAAGKTPAGRLKLFSTTDAGSSGELYCYYYRDAKPAHIRKAQVTASGYPLKSGDDGEGLGQIDPIVLETIKRAKRDAAFRKRIFKIWGANCALTGCNDIAVIDAAHIDSHSETGDNRASNGIPIRADLHRLMDLGKLVLIRSEGNWIVGISENVSFPQYRALAGKKIKVPT